jgi:ribosomal protein S6--L-glutamate ligase
MPGPKGTAPRPRIFDTGARVQEPTGAKPLIAVAAETRCLVQRQPAGMCAALVRAGYVPLLLDLQDPNAAPLQTIDLMIARGHSAALLALLARAEGTGVRTVNRCSAIAMVRDKATMSRTLAAAGLPTPATSCGPAVALAASFRPDEYPLVVKPLYDDGPGQVRVVNNRGELLELAWTEPSLLAQRLVPSQGFDLKLNVVGGQVFALHAPSKIVGDRSQPARAIKLTPALRALALRCGLLFGLELFSVTCIEMAAGPLVIDVDDFPSYAGVPGADDTLARFAIDRACASFERRRS